MAAAVAALALHAPLSGCCWPPAEAARAAGVAASPPTPSAAAGPAVQIVSAVGAVAVGDMTLVRAAPSTERQRSAPSGARRDGETREPSMTLEAPGGLTVLRYKPHVVLVWTHGGRLITGYEIERAMGGGPFRRIGRPGREARTFRDPGSAAGVMSVYRIRAVGTAAVSPYSKEVVVFPEPDRSGSSRAKSGTTGR